MSFNRKGRKNIALKGPTTVAIFFVWSTMREKWTWENTPAMSHTFLVRFQRLHK